jgi:hypothetical protein
MRQSFAQQSSLVQLSAKAAHLSGVEEHSALTALVT